MNNHVSDGYIEDCKNRINNKMYKNNKEGLRKIEECCGGTRNENTL